MNERHTAAAAPPILSIAGLSKWYGRLQVLHDVSLSVAVHERVVICGPSGSGKSTLLRCLNGLEPHQSGRVVIDGTEQNGTLAALALVRCKVGMVFQSFNLFPHLTVLENCTLAPVWGQKIPAAEAAKSAFAYLSRVHLAPMRTNIPASSPEASSNASPSPAPCACRPRSCCSMSRRRRSTPR